MLIFWGFIWVALTWRCFAITSICKEVVEGKTTKNALSFQYIQAGICFVAAYFIYKSSQNNVPVVVTTISLVVTGSWCFYTCVKSSLQLNKNKQNRNMDRPANPPTE
jgi:hypothetical protein